MNIVFKPSERPTLGVEIEVQVVDESGALATEPAATKILSKLEGQPGYKHELLECCVEVITDVCPTVGHIRKDLGDKVERLIETSDGLGYRIEHLRSVIYRDIDDSGLRPGHVAGRDETAPPNQASAASSPC